ncbi:hypothetical protein [Streptomyces sp. NPDC018693]|uniref:hypothetical protein n=1 Tax=unclassified Streptomyces TaxID=2593676 RepID=UPI00379A54FF
MATPRSRRTAGTVAVCVSVALVALTGCGDDDGASDPAERAASAAASLASEATDAFASATAEAGRRFDEIKEGVDAKDDVRLGTPTTDPDGHVLVQVTAENTADSTKSFAVQVNFTDASGSWLDTVVVTVPDVAPTRTAEATARSTRDLGAEDEVRTTLERAVRY